jgi:cyclase
MLKKRIIPCLDIRNGRTVKGVNFEGIFDAGDPIELAKRYVQEGADELVFLDITATVEDRGTILSMVERVAQEIDIPFAVGGGIDSVDMAARVIGAGADKVTVNSAAVKNPHLITEISQRFGRQCLVLAIDTKLIAGQWMVVTRGGRHVTELKTLDWARTAEQKGAGEILLTSMNNDGTKAGFALEISQAVTEVVDLPVIASGGAGSIDHFRELFLNTEVSAGLAASIFHFGEISIPQLKSDLKNYNIPLR